MKKLVIIHGVTGAIGSACLSHFASQTDTIVYGISRKAKDFREFCTNGKLPIATLICSVSGRDNNDHCADRMSYYFGQAINANAFESISYIHSVGCYPFEVDKNGDRFVSCDNNQDGIDDRCTLLTDYMFKSFSIGLARETKKYVQSIIFGGIADKHEPFAHISWWKTIKRMKEFFVESFEKAEKGSVVAELCKISVLNISSVLCPNELISRPFVFSKTDADPKYWLTPVEVAEYLAFILSNDQKEKLKEYELLKKKPNFDSEYYEDEKFTSRKIAELYRH
jgi:hypothetical protein